MNVPLVLIWGGVAVQVAGAFVSPWMCGAGMVLACIGNVLYHRAKGHAARQVVTAGFISLIWPVLGPVVGLLLVKPPPPGESGGMSYGSWTILAFIVGVLGAMAPALGGDMLSKGVLTNAAFSFAAWGAGKAGWHRTAIGLFVSGFIGCAAVFRAEAPSSPLYRRAAEARTIQDLAAVRARPEPSSAALPRAKTPPYHPDSPAVLSAPAPDDAGGWLFDASAASGAGRVLVNCTHTDSKGTRWADY